MPQRRSWGPEQYAAARMPYVPLPSTGPDEVTLNRKDGSQVAAEVRTFLVSNYDQAQQTIGEADENELGEGVLARVGFDGKVPPPGDGIFPSPQFVDMDANGMATVDPSSPVLEVTQGYVRIHQLQGNSNDGPGGPKDENGGDIVILELWKVD